MLQLCFDMFSKLYLLHYFQMASFDVMTIQEAQRAREEGEKRRRERDHKYGDRRRRRKVIYFTPDCILFFWYISDNEVRTLDLMHIIQVSYHKTTPSGFLLIVF